MRSVLALLYDIHGNLPALEAVLEDAGDADEFLLGGDYATAGAWPRETVERLRELDNATWIRGNADRWLVDRHDAPAPLDTELLEGVRAKRVVFGHTHVQFQRTDAGGIELLNPGSVGMPWDGDHRAAYAVIDGDRVEPRRVEYDWEAAVVAVRERVGELPARRMELARFQVD